MVTRHLSELSRAGMSPYGIAAELYRRKISAVKGIPWPQRNIPVGVGRYVLTAVNPRAATLGRSLGRQLICAPEFVLYRFREAQPHPREPEHVCAPLCVVHALRPSRALIRSPDPVVGQIQHRGVRFGIRGRLRQFQAVPSDAPIFLCRAHGEPSPFVARARPP